MKKNKRASFCEWCGAIVERDEGDKGLKLALEKMKLHGLICPKDPRVNFTTELVSIFLDFTSAPITAARADKYVEQVANACGRFNKIIDTTHEVITMLEKMEKELT